MEHWVKWLPGAFHQCYSLFSFGRVSLPLKLDQIKALFSVIRGHIFTSYFLVSWLPFNLTWRCLLGEITVDDSLPRMSTSFKQGAWDLGSGGKSQAGRDVHGQGDWYSVHKVTLCCWCWGIASLMRWPATSTDSAFIMMEGRSGIKYNDTLSSWAAQFLKIIIMLQLLKKHSAIGCDKY